MEGCVEGEREMNVKAEGIIRQVTVEREGEGGGGGRGKKRRRDEGVNRGVRAIGQWAYSIVVFLANLLSLTV